jgi:heat shock protein HtpX
VVLIVASWPNIVAIFLGLVCFGAAWLLRPRFPEFPRRVLARGECPAFYELADTVATTFGARPVHAIALTGGFNAAFFQAGWQQRRVLVVGLPLWEILDEQEKMALVAHELAHGVNGDPTRSLFVGGALYTLVTWHVLLRPASLREGPPAVNPILRLLSNVAMLALSTVPWLGAYLMAHLLWRDSQRAEYLADYLAASTSGTEAMLGLLEKLHLERSFEVTLQRIALSQNQDQDLFEALRERMASVPDRELERIRRVEGMAGSRLDATHPPTAHRIQVLRAHPVSDPSIKLPLSLFEQLDSELDAARQETQRKLIDMRHSWLYYR